MQKNKLQRRLTIAVLSFIMFFTLGLGSVYAVDNWDEWTGQTEIAEVTAITEQLVIHINEADAEIVLLEGNIVSLNNDIEVLQIQLDTLLAQSGNKIQQIADLTAALVSMTQERDILQNNLTIMTAERDQLVLDLQDMTDERDWLEIELATANSDIIQFKTDICIQIDLIASDNKRADYNEWCGVRP